MVSSVEVAKLAGVSQSTVSRVLNAPHKVSKKNVDKVKKAMKELNYRPNSIARSLVSKKTKTIALISGRLHNPFFVETTTSIVNYANQKGYNTIVFFENDDDVMSIYESALSMQVDGIILSSVYRDDSVLHDLQLLNIPYMMFNRRHNEGGNFVEIDNEKAGELAVKHLIDFGHKRIGYIGGPTHTSTFYGRLTGFINEIKNQNLYNESLIFEADTSNQSVRDAVYQMMSRKDKPTAIFAATDAMAIVVIDVLTSLGYEVPNDVSICGMDNVTLGSHRLFELTTVGYESDKDLGLIGIEHLINMIENKDEIHEEIQITLPPKLHVRKTTRDFNS